MVEMYEAGFSLSELGRLLAVSWTTIRKHFRVAGHRIRTKPEAASLRANDLKGVPLAASTRQKLAASFQRRMADPREAARIRGTARQNVSRMRPRRSQLERQVGDVLRALEIPAEPSWQLEGTSGYTEALADYYLPELDGVLEVHGTFHHGDPRAWPDGPVYRTQREVVANDARKASLYRDAGKALAIVWQLDFQADPFAAVLDAVLALAVARERRGTGA